MALGDPKGVNTEAISEASKRLGVIFSTMSSKSKIAGKDLDELTSVVKEVGKESKKLADTEKILLAASAKVNSETKKGTAALREMSEVVGEKLAKNFGLLTKEAELSQKVQLDGLRKQMAAIDKTQDPGRYAALGKEIRGIELSNFQANLRNQMELAKAQQTSGGAINRMSGAFKGLGAAAQLHGSEATAAIGEFLGLTSQSMMALTGPIGAAILAFGALATASAHVAKTAIGASQAGFRLGDSLADAGVSGTRFDLEVKKNSYSLATLGGSFIDQEEAYKLVTQASEEYGSSIVARGRDYVALTKMNAEAQDQARLQVVGFTLGLAKMSKVLGVSNEQAVKFGTRIAAMGTGGPLEAQKGLLVLSNEAKRLGVPLADLVSITEALGASAEFAGTAIQDVIGDTLKFTKVIEQLGNANVAGFRNLGPAEQARRSKQFADMYTKISDERLMALTMRPGESYESALTRLGNTSDASLRLQAVRRISEMSKNLTPEMQKIFAAQVAGVGGSPREQLIAGAELLNGVRTGALSESTIKKSEADRINRELDSAKTVGAQLAAGADPLTVIANLLKDILGVIVDVASHVFESSAAQKIEKSQQAADAAGVADRTRLPTEINRTRPQVSYAH